MKNPKTLFQTVSCSMLLSAVLIASCNDPKKSAPAESTSADTTLSVNAGTSLAADTSKVSFDSSTIPVTKKDIGSFPYLKAPEDYK
ncbi:hypothetical protein [Pedobacter hartonius]|uniref:Uncharacterized protein n=1 Tax=Pedobacter hartonius TaxID=425514 RepID=A0A1H4G5Q3_9SPHI|nr:hypothetical protein [Pedobacter hartonius]SEB04032.1 hypothetical protein SAMN05443550_1096 [Pedobacter hartonius]